MGPNIPASTWRAWGRLFASAERERKEGRMHSPVKVTDAKTGELKRWESPSGKPLAVKENGKLVLTDLGKRRGYRVQGDLIVR